MERGRVKQRLSQMFRASLRSSCSISSRDAAEAVQEPVFVSRRYAGDDDGDVVLNELERSHSLPPPPLPDPLFRRNRQRVAVGSQRLSVDCSCRPTSVTRESLKKAGKKEKRVSEIGALYEAGGDGEGWTCPPTSPVSPSYYCFKQMKEELEREEKRLATKKKKEKERRKGKKLLSNSYGFTSSSSEDSDNHDVGDFFSSDDGGAAPRQGASLKGRERETELLFSSRSISSDSSEFYSHPSRRHSRKKKTSRRQQKPRRGVDGGRSQHKARNDGFRPLVSISSSSSHSAATRTNNEAAASAILMEEEEVEVGREGFAVEKQSSDPYADFTSSMLEMIVEKQLFAARDLEQLLHCYLALNSPCHHPIILDAFWGIWETLFCN